MNSTVSALVRLNTAWLNATAVLVFLISYTAWPAPFELKSLNVSGANVVSQPVATIAMIFQPDCAWCKKQGEMLAKAVKECQSTLNVTLVGARGSKRALKQALKHYHPNIPAFMATPSFLRQVGGYQASPTTLLFDADGKLLTRKMGFIPHLKMSQVMSILSNGACELAFD